MKATHVLVDDFALRLFTERTVKKVQDLAATHLPKEVCPQALLAAFP